MLWAPGEVERAPMCVCLLVDGVSNAVANVSGVVM